MAVETRTLKGMYFQLVETKFFQSRVNLMSTCTASPRIEGRVRASWISAQTPNSKLQYTAPINQLQQHTHTHMSTHMPTYMQDVSLTLSFITHMPTHMQEEDSLTIGWSILIYKHSLGMDRVVCCVSLHVVEHIRTSRGQLEPAEVEPRAGRVAKQCPRPRPQPNKTFATLFICKRFILRCFRRSSS